MKINNKSSNQLLLINMVANGLSYLISFGISFFLSPYIVSTVGVEAYGFVGLANNFISYALLSTIALNSLSGRFITIKIFENDYEGANKYFTSVFYSNCFIATIVFLIEFVIWIRLEKIINIPPAILWDVKTLFAALFINCIISMIGAVFSVATFATNRLYLESIRSIESQVIRAIILIFAFLFFSPHVWYLGVTSLLTGIYCLLFNIHYTRSLLPEIKLKRKYYEFKAVVELVSSGIWSLINRLGQLLLDGLDLLITNLFIDATAMGVLSLAKTIPTIISSIVGSLVGVFAPNFTKLYAENKINQLISSIKQSMKIMGIISNLPIIILIVCGQDFFALWQPTQNSFQLQVLSILTVMCIVVSGGINCLYGIFTVVNKLKANSLVVIGSGIISAGITYTLIRFSSLGIYAVAGTSTVISIARNLFFTVPYGAHCLGLKWHTFYPEVIKPVIFAVISIFVSNFFVRFILLKGWSGLMVKGAITGVISILFGFFIVLTSEDRRFLFSKIKIL